MLNQLFWKNLARGELFKRCKKGNLQPQIFAGVWCLLLTLFQKRGRGGVSSLPLPQCEFSAYVPDTLNHLLHKGEQQEGYRGSWDNDGLLKHLAGRHKWSLGRFSLGSTGALRSLGSRNPASWPNLDLARRSGDRAGVSPNLWKAKATSAVQPKQGREGSCLLSVFLPGARRCAWAERLNSSDSSACYRLCHWLPECQILSIC